MPTAAAGSISLVENTARLTLADATAFRTLVGAEDQTQALDRIYSDELPGPANGQEYTAEELAALVGYAFLFPDPEEAQVYTAAAVDSDSSFAINESGTIVVQLFKCVAANRDAYDALDRNDVRRVFRNDVGQIIDHMFALFGTAGYLDAGQLTVGNVEGARPEDVPGQGAWLWCEMAIAWGIVE